MHSSDTSSNVRPTARTRLLDAAADLFYKHGINATGINAITTDAGVARMSLYNNFASKDELVQTYIEARHQEWLNLYAARLATCNDTPKDDVLAVFDAYIDHARLAGEQEFRGCGLLNAAAELPSGSLGRIAVRRHKEHVERILAEHLNSLVHDHELADQLAEHLSFLLEGAMERAGLEGTTDRLQHAKHIAAGIMEAW